MNKYSRPILILGATGTLGAYLALHLKEKGYDVIASGRRASDNGFFADYQIPYYSIDIKNKDGFSVLPQQKIGVIVHAAGVMPAVLGGISPYEQIDNIVTGTLNVLEYGRELGIEKVLFTHMNMNTRPGTDYQEDVDRSFILTGDHAVHSICKNAAANLIEHYYHQYGIKRFMFRLSNVYAYHPEKYYYSDGIKKPVAYRKIIDQAIKGEPIEIWGNPLRAKEITYVKDICQIFERAIESKLDGGIYKTGRGVGVTLEEQIKGIVDVFCGEKKSELIYCPEKPDARQFIHDIKKTQTDLGYMPEYDYRKHLEDYKIEKENNRFIKLWGSEEDYE
ncbi:MAG: NAD(P)-dependent oxidoreductase [Lachnospiraceae bacterium]|nr:NAD(P)-dependent oxidoreductase [Lachnospiraceae bacterium]